MAGLIPGPATERRTQLSCAVMDGDGRPKESTLESASNI